MLLSFQDSNQWYVLGFILTVTPKLQGRQYSQVKRNTLAENAEIYNLAAQAMEKLYGGADGNFATFEKRGRGLMTNMFGDMVSPDW